MGSIPSFDPLVSIHGFSSPSNSLSYSTSSTSSTSPISTSSPSTTRSSLSKTEVTQTPPLSQSADPNPWNHMAETTHRAIIGCAIIGLIITLCVCIFILLLRRRRNLAQLNGVQPGTLPLYTLHARPNATGLVGGGPGGTPGAPGRSVAGADAPPSYEEVVPPHLSLATGPPQMVLGAGPEDAVVADGKTPLSEIPFEDVMLEQSSSSSSTSSANQAFETVHHNGMGDTRGHTNS